MLVAILVGPFCRSFLLLGAKMRFVTLALIALTLCPIALATEPGKANPPKAANVPLTIADISDLLQMDSYNFKVDGTKIGDRLKIEVRSYTAPDTEPKVLWSAEFARTAFTCNGPLCVPNEATEGTFRLDFNSNSSGRRNALVTQDAEIDISVVSNWLKPAGLHGAFENPLKSLAATEKAVVIAPNFEAQLAMVTPDPATQRLIYLAPGVNFVGRPVGKPKKWDELFPRAEVVLQVLDK